MGFHLEDGTGFGFRAKVDTGNRLLTRTVSISEDQNINELNNKVWTASFEDVSPTASGDYIFYMKNTGDKMLHIADIRIKAETSVTQLGLHAVGGIATGGTDISPLSRTIGSSALPTAQIQRGTDITGLTSDGLIYYIHCNTIGKEEHLESRSKIRIPKGKAVALLVETGEASMTCVVSMAEEE